MRIPATVITVRSPWFVRLLAISVLGRETADLGGLAASWRIARAVVTLRAIVGVIGVQRTVSRPVEINLRGAHDLTGACHRAPVVG
jgi:hypothetical protein